MFTSSLKPLKTLTAFTLVELVVVITILWVLSTIGFISYTGYLAWARDSNRTSQLTKLSDALQVSSATKSLPLPDDSIEIQASGSTIAYQWYLWENVLEIINYTNGGTDPKDDSYYTYYLTKDRKNLQLMALMEEQDSLSFNPSFLPQSILPHAYAADYSERYPKVYGQKLWVLVSNDPATKNTPAQEITSSAIELTTTTDYTAYLSTQDTIEGTTAWELLTIIPNASCNRIKQTWWARWNGTYTINPNGTKIQVYCDMETDGGGWTMIGRSAAWSTGTIWWGVTAWSPTKDNAHYSLWNTTASMNFDEIMVGRYTSWKDIDYAVKFGVNSDDLDLSSSATFTTSDCKMIVSLWLTATEKTWNHCRMFSYWWAWSQTGTFFFRNTVGTIISNSYGLVTNKILAYQYNAGYWAFTGKQWIMFIR